MEALSRVKPSLRSYILITIAILGWGISSNFIEFGLKSIEPITFLGIRFILATLILTPITLIRYRKEFRELITYKWTWFIGISESLGLTFQYLGQEQDIPAGLAALLSLLFILIVPFISPFLLKEKLKPLHLMAVGIALIGVLLITSEGQKTNVLGGSMIGIFFLLTAAFSYAFYITTTSRLTTIERPKVNTFVLFYSILLIIAIFTGVLSLLREGVPVIENETWKWIIGLVIFSTLIAFFAYFEALKEISANMASVLLLLQALVPFFVDFVILGRRYSRWILVGSGFILIAMVIVVAIPYLENNRQDNCEQVMKEYQVEIVGGE